MLSPTLRQVRVMDVHEEFVPQTASRKQDLTRVEEKELEVEDLTAAIPSPSIDNKKSDSVCRKRKSPTRPMDEAKVQVKKAKTPMTWQKLLAPENKVSLISQTQYLIKAYREKCERLRVVQRAYDRTLQDLAELKEKNVAMKDTIRRQTEEMEDI